MKLKGSAYFLIFVLLVMLVIIVSAIRMEYFEAKLLPLLVGSVVFILAAVRLRAEILPGSQPLGTTEGKETIPREWLRYLTGVGWLAGFSLAIYLMGFVISTIIFCLAYMRLHKVRWLIAITSTILMTAFVYGLFELALGIQLYRGLLFSWLGY